MIVDALSEESVRERLAEVPTASWVAELLDAAAARAALDPGKREGFAELEGSPEWSGNGRDAAEPAQDETVEVTVEELAEDLPRRMFEANQDLALAIESWEELPVEGRRRILEQARWVATEILPLLEGRDE